MGGLKVHQNLLLAIVFAGLIGGIVWNLLTWLLSLPSSSSHALFGGLIGSAIASLRWSGVNWAGDGTKLDGVLGKVILPALASPFIAALCAGTATYFIYRVTSGVAKRFLNSGFRWGQIGTATLVSLAHGTNDAQKTMGVITLALLAPMGKVVAGVIFLIVAYAIVSGIAYIIATGKGSNYDITFKNLIPEIQKKS